MSGPAGGRGGEEEAGALGVQERRPDCKESSGLHRTTKYHSKSSQHVRTANCVTNFGRIDECAKPHNLQGRSEETKTRRRALSDISIPLNLHTATKVRPRHYS